MKIDINNITIIQSLLPVRDRMTGNELYKELSKLESRYKRGFEIILYDVKSKKEFLATLHELTKNAEELGKIPLLHIEMHGNENGLGLSSGEFVSWFELKDAFVRLNIATKTNLFIVIAACNGAHLLRILQPTDKSPCAALIGPMNSIEENSLLENYEVFYRELFATTSLKEAVNNLNATIHDSEKKYYATTAEIFFKQVFELYMEKSNSSESLEERARNISKVLRRQRLPKLPSVATIKELITMKEEKFEEYKKNFFMIDRFPENEARFLIKLSDLNAT